MKKKALVRTGRYILAAAPLVWIVWRIDLRELSGTVRTTAWWTVPVLVGAVLTAMMLQGVRWWMLLRAFTPSLSLTKALKCHFSSLFYSIALPTTAAQDVVRSFMITSHVPYQTAWGATWVARILGLGALALLSIYGFATIDRSVLPPGFSISLAVSFMILLALGVFSFSKRLTRPLRLLLERLTPGRALNVVGEIREGIYRYRGRKWVLVIVSLLTLLTQLILVGAPAVILLGITDRLLLAECFAFLPLIEIVCLSVPLTPNGLGVKEALLAIMFAHLGLNAEQLGVYILLGFLSIMVKLVGAIPVAIDLMRRRSPERGWRYPGGRAPDR